MLLLALNPTQSVLGDSITALGFVVCLCYAITALAYVTYYRHRLRERLATFVELGALPAFGALASLAAIFMKALAYYSQHKTNGQLVSYATPLAGIEIPVLIGIGTIRPLHTTHGDRVGHLPSVLYAPRRNRVPTQPRDGRGALCGARRVFRTRAAPQETR